MSKDRCAGVFLERPGFFYAYMSKTKISSLPLITQYTLFKSLSSRSPAKSR